MAVHFGGTDITLIANEATTQYYAVVMTSTAWTVDLADAIADQVTGFAQNAAAAQGDRIVVRVAGVTKAVAGATITPDDLLSPYNTTPGTVIPAASSSRVCGQALEGASAGETFAMVILQGGVNVA